MYETEKGTRRLLALQQHGGTAAAARALEMAPVSFQRWLDRRTLQRIARLGRAPIGRAVAS